MLKSKIARRHKSIRAHLAGSEAQPRLAVFRSNQHIYAQLIDDSKHKTIAAESDLKVGKGTKMERAMAIGESIAKKAVAKKVTRIVFDRGGFKYHGRIKAVAEGARKGGLEF